MFNWIKNKSPIISSAMHNKNTQIPFIREKSFIVGSEDIPCKLFYKLNIYVYEFAYTFWKKIQKKNVFN